MGRAYAADGDPSPATLIDRTDWVKLDSSLREGLVCSIELDIQAVGPLSFQDQECAFSGLETHE